MSDWVLLLGGSTGHGAATAKRLAKDGYGIIAFHFDRGEAKKIAQETIDQVNEIGQAASLAGLRTRFYYKGRLENRYWTVHRAPVYAVEPFLPSDEQAPHFHF